MNPTAQLGSHLVQHAQNIVSYTYNLMDATLRRQKTRVLDDQMSQKETRQMQMVNVLRRNKLEEDPLAPPPAIAILARDEKAEALQALRAGLAARDDTVAVRPLADDDASSSDDDLQ